MQTSIDNATHPNSEIKRKTMTQFFIPFLFCIEPRPGTGEAPAFHAAGAVATALCGHGQNGRHLELRRSSGPLPCMQSLNIKQRWPMQSSSPFLMISPSTASFIEVTLHVFSHSYRFLPYGMFSHI